MSVLLTPGEFASDYYMSSTGTKPANAVQVAIDLAEGDVSEVLGYPVTDAGAPTFISTQWTEEFVWPIPNRPIKLKKPRVISIDTVLGLHDSASCDCEWTELTACAFLFDSEKAIIHVRTCESALRCWKRCDCPHRARVTYTAGFAAADVTADTATGRRLRAAIALQARAYLNLLDFYTDGDVAAKSFSSLGYNETRDFVRTAAGRRLGLSTLSQQAADMLKPLMVHSKGAIILRSP